MKKNSFEEGTIIATVAIILVKILGMLYVIPFYSIVGSDGGALYSYAYNIYLLFLGISSAGLPNAISKIISEYNTLGYTNAKNRAYSLAKKIISIISIVCFILLFVFAEEIGKFIIGDLNGNNTFADIAFVIRCVAPSILVIPYLSITKGYLQGHKYMGPSSASQLIEQLVRILIILCGSYLALKVFNGTLSLAIGIAVSGALFGGIAAYIYLQYKINKIKPELDKDNCKEENKEDNISDKVIIKKIFAYAIPFIIINIVTNIYNFTDQILVLRTLDMLNFESSNVEFIASAISTWSPKICMVINAMAMGMTMSLIPAIVSAYAKKDNKEVESKVNKAVSMICFISFPLLLGLMILAGPAWTIFYGASNTGTMILRLALVSAFCSNIYMVVSTICQSLNKYKTVYFMSILGFLTNGLLDIPFMLLFNKLGLPAYLGSVVASITGFTLSFIIGLVSLKRNEHIKYMKTIKLLGKTLIPGGAMTVALLLLNNLLLNNLFDLTLRLESIIFIVIDAVIGGIIFVTLSYKLNILEDLFGIDMLNSMLRKVSFGLIKIKSKGGKNAS